MSQELLYTSASKGLKAGTSGFCTVVATQQLSATLAEKIESLSGYKNVFPPQDPKADQNPIAWSHVKLSMGGRNYSIVSRIAFYGLDYTQRTNKLAHHVVLDAGEQPPGGPAWLVSQNGFLQAEWDGEVKSLPIGRRIPVGELAPMVCSHWKKVTGDAGWGGVLAEELHSTSPRTVYLIVPLGLDVRPLFVEATSLLPITERWNATFSTYYTRLPQGVQCLWRCVLQGSDEAKRLRPGPSERVIDLTKPLGEATGGSLVEAARTGKIARPRSAPTSAGPRSSRSASASDEVATATARTSARERSRSASADEEDDDIFRPSPQMLGRSAASQSGGSFGSGIAVGLVVGLVLALGSSLGYYLAVLAPELASAADPAKLKVLQDQNDALSLDAEKYKGEVATLTKQLAAKDQEIQDRLQQSNEEIAQLRQAMAAQKAPGTVAEKGDKPKDKPAKANKKPPVKKRDVKFATHIDLPFMKLNWGVPQAVTFDKFEIATIPVPAQVRGAPFEVVGLSESELTAKSDSDGVEFFSINGEKAGAIHWDHDKLLCSVNTNKKNDPALTKRALGQSVIIFKSPSNGELVAVALYQKIKSMDMVFGTAAKGTRLSYSPKNLGILNPETDEVKPYLTIGEGKYELVVSPDNTVELLGKDGPEAGREVGAILRDITTQQQDLVSQPFLVPGGAGGEPETIQGLENARKRRAELKSTIDVVNAEKEKLDPNSPDRVGKETYVNNLQNKRNELDKQIQTREKRRQSFELIESQLMSLQGKFTLASEVMGPDGKPIVVPFADVQYSVK